MCWRKLNCEGSEFTGGKYPAKDPTNEFKRAVLASKMSKNMNQLNLIRGNTKKNSVTNDGKEYLSHLDIDFGGLFKLD